MAFTVLESDAQLVLGMPFFLRFEAQPMWKLWQYVIRDAAGTHTLQAESKPHSWFSSQAVCVISPTETSLLSSSTTCTGQTQGVISDESGCVCVCVCG